MPLMLGQGQLSMLFLNFFLLFLKNFMCMGILPEYVCAPLVCGAHTGQKRALNPHNWSHVVAGNQT